MSWKDKCLLCSNVLRSGKDGIELRCTAVKVGGRPVFVITARSNRADFKRCGPEAKLFLAVPNASLSGLPLGKD